MSRLKRSSTDVYLMKRDTPLELLREKEQLRTLRDFLSPAKSSIRPFLVLFARKNLALHHESGQQKYRPNVRWYQRQLMRAGLVASTDVVRSELDGFVEMGVLDRKTASPRHKATTQPGSTTSRHSYWLNEAIYPSVEMALKTILGTASDRRDRGQEDR